MSVIVDALVDFVFPKKCVICGQEGTFLCSTCLQSLAKAEQVCPNCGRRSLGGWTHPRCRKKYSLMGLQAIYSYRDKKVRKIVEAIKFGFNKELIKILMENTSPLPAGRQAGPSPTLGEGNILVVPVPLYWYRLNWRGFNQAEEVGKVLETDKVKLSNILKRVKNTKQQARLTNLGERKENVRGAFALNLRFKMEDLKFKKILLVDDVFTTGESMKECCRTLMKAGVKEVWGLVLAH